MAWVAALATGPDIADRSATCYVPLPVMLLYVMTATVTSSLPHRVEQAHTRTLPPFPIAAANNHHIPFS